MKKLLFVGIFFPSLLFGQAGEWTWMKGPNTTNQKGIYGTQGVEAPANVPGGRYESGSMRDAAGNFWLFGGSGYDFNTGPGFLSDLWRYNPSTDNWAFMKGDNVIGQLGVYGTKGVSSPLNKPGGRYAFITWSDEVNGALWLFGGAGLSGYLNDMWKYDITSNEWTWISGSNVANAPGVYGTKGVAAASNVPGARNEVTCSWIDSTGNLWLFGGGGNDSAGSYGDLNDLWKYNVVANQWTWVSGANVINSPGIYGTKGVAAPLNEPRARHPYNSWKDKKGNFWLFGGIVNTNLYYNDLWKYDISSNQWTWMSGSNTGLSAPSSGGHYGTQCIGDTLNVPARRFENKANWVDTCGKFWTYGGFTPIGDLWSYDPLTNQWMWVSGDNTPLGTAVYGTQGVANPLNKPGARYAAPSWKHIDGSLWMFGGHDASGNKHNELWRYVIDPSCSFCVVIPPPVASFQASDTALCANDCISFTDHSTNATSWQWTFSGAFPPASTDQNPSVVCYSAGGNYDVQLIAYNAGGSDTLTFTNYIKVQAAPPLPHVVQTVNTLHFTPDSTYDSYQWYDSTSLIIGATDTFLIITHSGNYNIQVANKTGCKIATGINVTYIGIVQFTHYDSQLMVSPDPVNDKLRIIGLSLSGGSILTIYNVLGEIFYHSLINNPQSEMDVSSFPSGIYFIHVTGERKRWVGRFVKE